MQRSFLLPCVLFVLLLGAPQWAQAHKVICNAWYEAGLLTVEAAFGDGSAASAARVTVLEAGHTVLEGTADAQGVFQAPLPAALQGRTPDLLVVVDAGQGHRAEYALSGQDLAQEVLPGPSVPTAGGPATAPSWSGTDAEQLRELIREALRTELEPLRRELRRAQHSEPGLKEILGGLGYIIGLAGLASFWLRRRKP